MILKRTLCLATALAVAAGALVAAPREEPAGSKRLGETLLETFRDGGAVGPGAQFKVFAALTKDGRPVALMLLNDNGTPSDCSDDTMVFCVGEENVTDPSGIKRRSWVAVETCYLTDPLRCFAIMQLWDVGLDNPTITRCTM